MKLTSSQDDVFSYLSQQLQFRLAYPKLPAQHALVLGTQRGMGVTHAIEQFASYYRLPLHTIYPANWVISQATRNTPTLETLERELLRYPISQPGIIIIDHIENLSLSGEDSNQSWFQSVFSDIALLLSNQVHTLGFSKMRPYLKQHLIILTGVWAGLDDHPLVDHLSSTWVDSTHSHSSSFPDELLTLLPLHQLVVMAPTVPDWISILTEHAAQLHVTITQDQIQRDAIAFHAHNRSLHSLNAWVHNHLMDRPVRSLENLLLDALNAPPLHPEEPIVEDPGTLEHQYIPHNSPSNATETTTQANDTEEEKT